LCGARGEVEERRAEEGDAGEVEKRVLSEFGGSLEWRSMAVGRSSCSAGSTLTDIVPVIVSTDNYQYRSMSISLWVSFAVGF
jgi:hypothetical protein